MILVAGLTPAWQQILTFDRLRVGEVNRARESHGCASGKVLNVGLALARLGADAHTLSPLGGWAREPIEREFESLGCATSWIATSAATRVCTTILDSTGETTELVQNAAPLAPNELAAFREAFCRLAPHATAIVWTGSLPAGTPASIVAELLADDAARNKPAVLDLRGAELLAALAARPALVKPNREELQQTAGRPLESTADVLSAARMLIERGAQSVLVSQGGKAALLIEGERAWQVEPAPAARVVNPIGCGDCLAAGTAWGLERGLPLIEAVRLGFGAAADNLADLLPARLDRARVERLASSVRVTALYC